MKKTKKTLSIAVTRQLYNAEKKKKSRKNTIQKINFAAIPATSI